jgi:type IV pilus assembly protein PilF
MGEYRKADEYLLKAATSKAYNRSAETYENLAICGHRQGNIDDALMYLRTALQHQPGRARSWYMFVELLIANEQWQEAKVAYRQYEKVVPVTSDTLNLAIEIEEGLGNKKVAQGYADMLQTLYPEQAGQPRKVILRPTSRAVEVAKESNAPKNNVPQNNAPNNNTLENKSTPAVTQPVAQNTLLQEPETKTEEVAEEKQPAASATNVETQKFAEVRHHILQEGETLYQISRRYSVKVQSLVKWNNIQDVSNLSIGQKIIVSEPN